jgi:FtsP/CotA-like multicopper oxidase with cupredoxin domain
MSDRATPSQVRPHGVNRSRIAPRLSVGTCLLAVCLGSSASSQAPDAPIDFCQRLEPGSVVPEPDEVRSHDGVLRVDLTIHNWRQPDGSTRYCYLTPDGKLSPTLRLKPGELLILHFKNKLTDLGSAVSTAAHMKDQPETPLEAPIGTSQKRPDPCTSGAMTPVSANLHFHGLTVAPACHQDDVLKTSIQPDDPPFEYRFRIPDNEPPGLYWYHPHIYGFSKVQVLGGASGALVVEGAEQANPH